MELQGVFLRIRAVVPSGTSILNPSKSSISLYNRRWNSYRISNCVSSKRSFWEVFFSRNCTGAPYENLQELLLSTWQEFLLRIFRYFFLEMLQEFLLQFLLKFLLKNLQKLFLGTLLVFPMELFLWIFQKFLLKMWGRKSSEVLSENFAGIPSGNPPRLPVQIFLEVSFGNLPKGAFLKES